MLPDPQPQFIEAPALLIEARYRERPLSSRLLLPTERRGFSVGVARGADAPIDAIFLPGASANDNHVLVEPSGAGFLVNLSPAMRARLERTATHLRIACGEVVFDISVAAPPPALPRPWLSPRWRQHAPYTVGVAIVLLILLAIIQMVPSDPHALSLDDLGRTVRLDSYRIKPPLAPEPPPSVGRGPAGGTAPTVASGPTGAAGDRKARPADARRATKGPAVRQDAHAVEAYVRANTMLAILDGPRAASFAQVLASTPALGGDAETVLAHLEGQTIASAYGGGFGPTGTGAGGADTGKPLLGGTPGISTHGRFGDRGGPRAGYGDNLGRLVPRKPREITVELHSGTVRGGLDKEIVRRIVRQHLNEVRYCYEQSLVRRPSLAGRVVVNFTIAGTGRVLVSTLQSSSLGEVAAESCIVAATRRWDYPRPAGGGLVIVSYPFQLTPAGG